MMTRNTDKKAILSGLGIGRRIIVYVTAFSGFIILITSVIHFYINYQAELNELDRQFLQIETTYLENIKASLRPLDDQQLGLLLNETLRLRDIVYIEIIKDQNVISKTGVANSKSPISREYSLKFAQESQQIDLGVLRVTASYEGIYDRLFEQSRTILINNIIIIICVIIFIFFFVQTSITKHLTRIADYAKKIDPAVIQPPLRLIRKDSIASYRDEMDEVVDSISEMQRNLHSGYAALTASENRLKNFTEAASDWLWEMDAELLYTYLSGRFFEISGFNPETVIGQPQIRLCEVAEDNPEWKQHLQDLEDHKPFRDFTFSLMNPEGQKNWLRISGRPVFDPPNNFAGYLGTGSNITNEIRAREEAVETTLRFLDAIENVSDGIAFWDSEDQFVLCNKIFRAQAGDAAHLLVRGNSFEAYMRGLLAAHIINKPEDEKESWLRQRILERKTQTAPIEVYRDGKWLLVRDNRSSDGSTVSVITDITEVKQRDQQLQLVTDAVPILLSYVDNQLRYQLINKEFEEWFHVSRHHFQGQTIEDTLPPETYEQIRPHINTVLCGKFVRFKFSLPIANQKEDGTPSVRHVEASFTPNFNRDKQVSGFYIAAIDVTELIKAEEETRKGELALIEQTQTLQASFDAIAQGISVWDEDLNLTAWNDAFEQFIGFPSGFLHRGISLQETSLKAAELGVIDKGLPEQIENFYKNSLLSNSELELPDGRHLVVHRVTVPDGGYVTTITDVTESARAQEQLQHAQKLEAIGQLTGGVAHDFNNLLAIIIGSLSQLEDRVKDERTQKLLSAALRASRRGSELTQRLLAFGRRQALITETSNANDLVEGILELMTRTLGLTIEVKSILGNDLWAMDVDRGQLENALLNLAINARDAMPDGGRLTIETANILLGKDYADQHQDVEPGAYVMIAVSDTGTGMTPEVVERAIEPFFTTKKVGVGSGLGLSMIYGFVNQSGGHMNIYSEPGKGTVIRIYLPVAEGDVAYNEQVHDDMGYQCNGEHILVIEDDPDVRMTTVNILEHLGYKVTEAADDTQAMAVVEKGEPIDLVFSDVFLQGSKNGPAIVDDIRELFPDMKILFTSGYTANQFADTNFVSNGMEFIPKPFEISTLSKKLREILTNGNGPS